MIPRVRKVGSSKGPSVCVMTTKSTGNTTCDDEIDRKQAYGKWAPAGKT